MNLQHLKYAVTVAKTGSISRAAEELYVGQPNISRAIKELEDSLQTDLFERTPKGMLPTPDGELFIKYAASILKQVDEVEKMFDKNSAPKKKFSISAPRASYIGEAFSNFTVEAESENAELTYNETNSYHAIKNVAEEGYRLGIVRYTENYDKFYEKSFSDKGLISEKISEFRFLLLVSEKSPLTALTRVTLSDLSDYVEIAHADPFVPSLPFATVLKEELPEAGERRIFVFERASQLEILSSNPATYMWVSPMPEKTLKRYGLTVIDCADNRKIYKDVLIRKNDYVLTKLDREFIGALKKVRRECFNKKPL